MVPSPVLKNSPRPPRTAPAAKSDPAIGRRIAALDWPGIEEELALRGYATAPGVLTPAQCRDLIALYDDEKRFRKTVVMARHNYGLGEYRYFDYPLPPLVRDLRRHAYARLAPVAQDWADKLGTGKAYPAKLDDYIRICNEHGQTKATPLLLRYQEDDFNCLHQDLYGEVAFPLQMAVCLNRTGTDFTGGEFLLVEQRPRAQSRGEAIVPEQGEAIFFANNERPVLGKRGYRRVKMRHGVSRLRSGHRMTLGIIFHDAA